MLTPYFGWEVRENTSTWAGRRDIIFLLGAHFVWDARASTSTFHGRRGMFLIGCAFRVGSARDDVKFGWQAWHCFY